MAKIDIPEQLRNLIKKSDLEGPLLLFATRASEILDGSTLPFFPDYTDHGITHINRVLRTQVELVPLNVWPLLNESDAAIIIGATLLHDIAMHLHPKGFLELISENTRFQPLPWFKEDQIGHSADRPWNELWQDYRCEARKFSTRALINIIGEESVRNDWKFRELPKNAGTWETNDRLIVGEFIRRHHARMAHEIAIYGFPGIPTGIGESQFPALSKDNDALKHLGDLIGIAARSHSISLRVCKCYLDWNPLYAGTPRPMNSVVMYPMALLRVADYLQIDRQRAPSILLHLRNPQSPQSVQEWKKHQAIQCIGPAADPSGKMITVTRDLTLELYLQLRVLLEGLQREIDHAAAVLDEVYGPRRDLGLDELGLIIRRIYSNLDMPGFRKSLPFVPEPTGFSVDPTLMTLLVEPLYGKEPSVGVRELLQNSVDAVRELHKWCEFRSKTINTLTLADQEADVLIEFVERDAGQWLFRITDKGIGMRSETIQNFFLRAGASFRKSVDWAKEFQDEHDQSLVVRSGRFGVGVFAAFLLGGKIQMRTRYVDDEIGFAAEITPDSRFIELRIENNLPIGTTIAIELSPKINEELSYALERHGRRDHLSLTGDLFSKSDWFVWDWPVVSRRIVTKKGVDELPQRFTVPTKSSEWAMIQPKRFDAIYWTFGDAPSLSCNGLIIRAPEATLVKVLPEHSSFNWPSTSLRAPKIAVLDSNGNLPLTLQRYDLANRELPSIEELVRDVALSVVAHALVCGPVSHAVCPNGTQQQQHPLSRLNWCFTDEEFVLSDPWLYSILDANEHCLVYGKLAWASQKKLKTKLRNSCTTKAEFPHAYLCWNEVFEKPGQGLNFLDFLGDQETDITVKASEFLQRLCETGVCDRPYSARAILSVKGRASLRYHTDAPEVKIQRIKGSQRGRHWYEFTFNDPTPAIPLEKFLGEIENIVGSDSQANYIYAADLEFKPNHTAPETEIAKVWNECLGATGIPLDAKGRQASLERGKQHPELRRHIDAWQKMKAGGSKWIS